MDDREIVLAMRAGALPALAAIAGAYDSHAGPLYGYCSWLLDDPASAADALRHTFLMAMSDLRGTRNPELVRPLLYAVAREECARRRAAPEPRQTPAAGFDRRQTPAAGFDRRSRVGGHAADLWTLINNAIADLDPREREAVELIFRHGLSHADLAIVLGMSRHQASALTTRLCGNLERTLAVPLVAHISPRNCRALNELLPGWDGHLTEQTRSLIESHIEQCELCLSLRHLALHPAIAHSLGSPTKPPADLRQQVVALYLGVAAGTEKEAGAAFVPARHGIRGNPGLVVAAAATIVWVLAAVSVTLVTVLG